MQRSLGILGPRRTNHSKEKEVLEAGCCKQFWGFGAVRRSLGMLDLRSTNHSKEKEVWKAGWCKQFWGFWRCGEVLRKVGPT